MDVTIKGILGIDALLHLLVLVRKLLRFLDHLLNLLLRQAALVVGYDNLFTLSSGLVLCPHVQDSVGINLEGHFDLWLATGSWGNSTKLKLAKQVVVLCHGPFALIHLDVHSRLVVLVGRENLRLLGWDDGVPADDFRHDAADGLDAKSQRCHIQYHHVPVTLAAEDASLYGCTVCHGLIGVDAAVGLLAIEEVFDKLLDLWDAGGATHQHNLIDLILLEPRVLHYLLHWAKCVLEEVVVDLLEACPRKRLGEVNAVVEGINLHVGLVCRAKCALRLFDLSAELLDGTLVL
mmetsp:Transcript_120714/g.352550  ORF Transcript_120714/g.352550 Transcript_120714/m.352550 type:complete len:291 (-) Transcript_120714:928-1800(-)